MSNRAAKGSQFERSISRQLSLWWTQGERDDVFWRTAQSGGRATTRGAKGLSTAGSYGDITALDPIGIPLLERFTIELKRGAYCSHPGEVLDLPRPGPFAKVLGQLKRETVLSEAPYWMLILKRDRRDTLIFIPSSAALLLPPAPVYVSYARYRFVSHLGVFDFMGWKLQDFLDFCSPSDISKLSLSSKTT